MGEERRGGIVATLHVLGGMRCPPEMIKQQHVNIGNANNFYVRIMRM
jgi:hypothetical protein